MELKETTVIIKTQEGDIETPALIHPCCAGLAVTMHCFGRFTVTHIKSGMKLCQQYRLMGDALLVLGRMAMIANENGISWDVDQDKVKQNIKQIFETPVPFSDVTFIQNGEERPLTCQEYITGLSRNYIDPYQFDEFDNESMAFELLYQYETEPTE